MTEQFDLTDDDLLAIEIAKKVARRFLRDLKVTPPQVVGLGNALYALERLPVCTPGAEVEFTVSLRHGSKDYYEMTDYIAFTISDGLFAIQKGWIFHDHLGDHESEPGWWIESQGYRETKCNLHLIEAAVFWLLDYPGAEISVSDSSEIEFE